MLLDPWTAGERRIRGWRISPPSASEIVEASPRAAVQLDLVTHRFASNEKG
jgi:hypothetical protein